MTDCAARGPYLPVGDTDWTCRVHNVDLVVTGDDLMCPVTRTVLGVRIARRGRSMRDMADALDRGLAAANAQSARRFTIDLDDPALRARLLEAVADIWNRSDPASMPMDECYGLDVDRVLAALPTPKETT